MAKTFKTQHARYTVNGRYFSREKFALVGFEFVGDSKSERSIKSYIAKNFDDCASTKDVIIDNIIAETVTTVYRVNASMADIINACIAANIDVDIIDADADADAE